MKVALVITGLGMGGAEHVVVNLADKLIELDNEVLLVYLTGKALVLPREKKVKIVSINMNGYKDFFKAYIKLRLELKQFKPDVVHGHMVHANILTRLVRLSLNIPRLISTAHSTNEGGRLRMLAYRLTDRLCDITTNVSEEAVSEFLKKKAVNPNKMICVHNGIPTNIYKYSDIDRINNRKKLNITSRKMLLAVGRLEVAKDYPNLLKAISLLKKERTDFKLFVAGDGSQRENLIQMVSELDIQDYVEFLGVHRNIPSLMSASDIFVLSSAWEGFGLVVAEAMACQRVVVATDCGGVREVIGQPGILVKPKDSIKLASALFDALNLNNDETYKLGLDARSRIKEHYSLDAAITTWLKIYKNSY